MVIIENNKYMPILFLSSDDKELIKTTVNIIWDYVESLNNYIPTGVIKIDKISKKVEQINMLLNNLSHARIMLNNAEDSVVKSIKNIREIILNTEADIKKCIYHIYQELPEDITKSEILTEIEKIIEEYKNIYEISYNGYYKPEEYYISELIRIILSGYKVQIINNKSGIFFNVDNITYLIIKPYKHKMIISINIIKISKQNIIKVPINFDIEKGNLIFEIEKNTIKTNNYDILKEYLSDIIKI